MSFYTVIEDYFVRPLPEPPEYLIFKDWFSFGAFIYTVFIGISGTMYTYSLDLQDFKSLRDI